MTEHTMTEHENTVVEADAAEVAGEETGVVSTVEPPETAEAPLGSTREEPQAETPDPLTAHVYLGELGHEILSWAPAATAAARGSRRHIFASRFGRARLYQDELPDSDFIPIPDEFFGGVESEWMGLSPSVGTTEVRRQAEERIIEWMKGQVDGEIDVILSPPGSAAAAHMLSGVQQPLRLDNDEAGGPTRLVVGILARARAFGGHKNQSQAFWDDVVAGIRRRMPDATVVALGTAHGNMLPKGAQDLRGRFQTIDDTLDQLSRVTVVVGGSSGGTHLSIAARRPTVVFGEDRLAERYRLQAGGEQPVACDFIGGGWAPDAWTIARRVHRMVQALDDASSRFRSHWLVPID